MKLKNIFVCCLFFLLILYSSEGTAQRSNLMFNEDGRFKIAQFTDIHYKPGVPESEPTVELIREVLLEEQPDLVVFTGDIVCGTPAAEGWHSVLAPVVEAGIPFAFTPGNHDDEYDLTRDQIIKVLNTIPGYLGKKPSAASRYGDYMLEVKSKKNKDGMLLYFFDSNAYSTLEGMEGYGWFSFKQVNWYNTQRQKNVRKWGKALPALAFFHIPVPEYRLAFDSGAKRTGQRNEDECAPNINTGMFAALLQGREVMGTFAGHDHVNDYLVNYYGIGLAYGRWSGGKTTYGDLQHGSRIIVLEEDKRRFETWIRLINHEITDRVFFPDDLE